MPQNSAKKTENLSNFVKKIKKTLDGIIKEGYYTITGIFC
jgi:hypothetical protein